VEIGLDYESMFRKAFKPRSAFSLVVRVTILIQILFACLFFFSSPPHTTRYVILAFDDSGQDNQGDESARIMGEYGYKGVAFLVVEWADKSSPVWSSLVERGWELGSHTWSHKNVSHLSTEMLYHEILDSRNWIEQTFNVTVISFAYPYSKGSDNQTVIRVLAEAGYLYARESMRRIEWEGARSFQIGSCPIKHDDYETQIAKVIDDSRKKGIAVAMFHRVNSDLEGWGSLTPQEFRYCLEQIRRNNLEVITFKDLEKPD